jgi:hypothetical protein
MTDAAANDRISTGECVVIQKEEADDDDISVEGRKLTSKLSDSTARQMAGPTAATKLVGKRLLLEICCVFYNLWLTSMDVPNMQSNL